MQFERISADERVDLPKPSIDTGMGLERIAALLQGKHDNYDTDLIRALIEASANASNTEPDGDRAVSHRVIADHLRACSFLVADGVLPSNEGRGYVLRRIMRRGMRHAHLLAAKNRLCGNWCRHWSPRWAKHSLSWFVLRHSLRKRSNSKRRVLRKCLDAGCDCLRTRPKTRGRRDVGG